VQYEGGSGSIITIPAPFAPADSSTTTYVSAAVTSWGPAEESPGQVLHLGIKGGVLESIYQGGSVASGSYVPLTGSWRISG
jgi:hypothetical protein